MKKNKKEVLKALRSERLYFDGGMGSLMQKRAKEAGLDGIGTVPENLGITHPDLIRGIHQDYVDAGADVVLSCTFGANGYKLAHDPAFSQKEIVRAAIKNARAAHPRFVALDIGPIGSLIGELGDVSEEEAYNYFKEVMVEGEKAGADMILIETMTDLQEARLALLAAKENTDLPVVVSMTFEETGRTLTGSTPEICALVLESLGADAVGTNCSTGPEQMAVNARKMMLTTSLPIIVQPNAGLPVLKDGETVYDIDADTFSDVMKQIAENGASHLGGCCGTTPEHIRKTVEKTRGVSLKKRGKAPSMVSSAYVSQRPGRGVLAIGESINPTSNKQLKQALLDEEYAQAAKLAVDQANAGAQILDINCGVAGIDEAAAMEAVIHRVGEVSTLPLQIDSTKPEVIEKGLRTYCGRAIVNSVNGEEKSLDSILPIVKKYGAMVIGLTLDENGIPETAEEKVAIAKKIISRAEEYGIPKEDIVIDCLCMTASTQQKAAQETLKAVRLLREEIGVNTTLGVSNISFGLPCRSAFNAAFLSQALQAGLNMPIVSVLDPNTRAALDIFNVIDGSDEGCLAYTTKYKGMNLASPEKSEENSTEKKPESGLDALAKAVCDGLKEETVSLTEELLTIMPPMEIVNGGLIPGLDQIGALFETGEAFLPNLLFSADAVQGGFEKIKAAMAGEEHQVKGEVLLATVEGDVHDIGKNILKVIMENYGYEIVDLGKDVKVQDVVEMVKKHDARLLGLSALMTTSVGAMEETIKAVRAEAPKCKIMVGGAVMTPEFSEEIGADFYGADAKAGVDIARKVFEN